MDSDFYFSEREGGIARTTEPELSRRFWNGFRSLIQTLMNDGSFAQAFPERCIERPLPVDCDGKALWDALHAEVPGFSWPQNGQDLPDTLVGLDAVEFFARHVSEVASRRFHSFMEHYHFVAFDREIGLKRYAESLNRLFRRNGHPYELGDDGKVRRTVPEILGDVLETELRTGDADLDRMISSAIERFRDPDPETRREALERLWDAWERLKTLPDPDKKKGSQKLLDTIPCDAMRERIDTEAHELTEIGNKFRIRHSETDRIPIDRDIDVDYLFHRLYAVIRYLVMNLPAS